MLKEEKKSILTSLIESGFRFDPNFGFRLSSGRRTDFYINCKPILLKNEKSKILGDVIFSQVLAEYGTLDVKPTHLAGVAIGGIPLATAVSFSSIGTQLSLDCLIVRNNAKSYGTNNIVEGHLDGSTSVIIVDDVITTGDSIIRIVKTLRSLRINVLGAFVIVDRLEGGRESLEQLGLHFSSLFTREDFI